MKIRMLCITLMVAAALSSCAFMKDVEGAWGDKSVQSAIKEVNSVVDALKGQDGQRLFYKLLVNNAQELSADCEILSRVASDSYMRRVARHMQLQTQDLYFAAKSKNQNAAQQAIKEILVTWGSLEDYVKPNYPPVQQGDSRLF